MPVELQNRLFKYFTDTLAAIISQAKRTGKYDMGILGKCYFSTHILDIVYWIVLLHIGCVQFVNSLKIIYRI